jgi:hypothetical protein
MIPDWAAKATAVPYAQFGDPQSLNLYSYVRNNPVTAVDADGHASDDLKRAPKPTKDPQPHLSNHGQSMTQEQKDKQQYQQALEKRKQEFLQKQAAPAPGSPEYIAQVSGKVSAEMKAGNKVIAGMAVLEAVGVGVVVGGSATAEAAVETAGTAARATGQAASAGARAAVAAGASGVTTAEVAAATHPQTVQFVNGVLSGAFHAPPPQTFAGQAGSIVGKVIGHLLGL